MTIVRQKVLPNTKLSDDVGIWEGSIVYEFLYLMLEAKAIVGLMAGFLVEVVIFIEVPSGRYKVRHGWGLRFNESFVRQILICLGKGHP